MEAPPTGTPASAGEAPEVVEHVTRLVVEGREIWLVGTAHVSRKSSEEVQRLINEIRPDAVCVELDAARYETLMDESRWRHLSAPHILRERRPGLFLASLLFAGFQKRLGLRLGTRPGAEMLAAAEAARGVGAELVLADRDVQTTLARCHRSLGPLERLKVALLLSILSFAPPDIDEAQVEELKTKRAMADAMETFAQHMPALKTPLIDERDQYLAASIASAPGKRIVAVVGAAHAVGIARHLGTTIDRAEISAQPTAGLRDRLLPYLLPLVALSCIALSGHAAGHETGALVASFRILTGATLGVVLAAVALGAHPIAVLGMALLSPLTFFAPSIPFGRLSGLLQARLAPPAEEAAAELRDDVLAPRRARRNLFIRAIAIAVLSPAARTVGAAFGVAWGFALLFGS